MARGETAGWSNAVTHSVPSGVRTVHTPAGAPITKAYFPGLTDDRIPAIGCDPGFVTKVEERLQELRAAGLAVSKVDRVREAR